MLKVFLAEDEFVIREGIKNNIDWSANGYEFCGEAGDGELAISMIMELKPDIVITDIRMPFMDGLSLSRLIKKSLPDTEIIVLSGYEEFEYAKESIKIGVAEYLLKPISGDALLREVNTVADKIRKKREEWSFVNKRRSAEDNKASEKDNLEIDRINLKHSDKKKLISFLHTGSPEEASDFTRAFLKEMGEEAIESFIFRQYIAMDVYFNVSGFMKEAGLDKNIIKKPDITGDTLKDKDSTTRYMEEIILSAVTEREKAAADPGSSVVDEALRYIEDNFNNEDLSLNMLASHVGVSPNHLSALFTRMTGQSFIKYLTDCRMNRAKEMLRAGNKRTSEISAEVGYKDPHYFSALFKKTQGVTPTEYRAGKQAEEEDK